jgi:hypothetical protein
MPKTGFLAPKLTLKTYFGTPAAMLAYYSGVVPCGGRGFVKHAQLQPSSSLCKSTVLA